MGVINHLHPLGSHPPSRGPIPPQCPELMVMTGDFRIVTMQMYGECLKKLPLNGALVEYNHPWFVTISWYGWCSKDEQMSSRVWILFHTKWANDLLLEGWAPMNFVKEKRVTYNDKSLGVWNEKSFAKKRYQNKILSLKNHGWKMTVSFWVNFWPIFKGTGALC